jgi:hypothetical protein
MATLKNTTINDTGFLQLPSGTTAQRPGSPVQGYTRFNTTWNVFEYYNGTNWLDATTGEVTGVPFTITDPTISGSAVETATLTASTGTWTNSPTSYTYQWKRNGVNISGATSSTYKLVANDIGTTITVEVKGINSAGTSAGAISNATATVVIAATGGTTSEAGGYRTHTFTSSGTFTTNIALSVEYLVVAGGGAGGGINGNAIAGGGGGAGGMISSTTNVSVRSFTVTVGAGGTGSAPAGTSGDSSSIQDISSTTGGGYGGYLGLNNGAAGGSGGGGRATGSVGTGTSGQGNNGGSGSSSASEYGGGGGGGKGAVGGNGSATIGGVGGVGQIWPSGGSTYYAGGGGGGRYATDPGGAGGLGGGGSGRRLVAGDPGTQNTGGGGGGTGGNGTAAGGNGGSGIVIIRYLI